MALAALVVSIVGTIVGIVIALGSAWSARRSAVSAERMRLDNLGPVLVVRDWQPLRERWQIAPRLSGRSDYAPGVVQPGSDYHMPRDRDVHLLLGGWLRVANQGSTTLTVHIPADRLDRCDCLGDAAEVLAPPSDKPSPRITEGFQLDAGQEAGVIVRMGSAVGELVQASDDIAVIHRACILTAATSEHGVRQQWELELTAMVLTGVHDIDSQYSVTPHTLPEACKTELPREYPKMSWRKVRGRPEHSGA